MNNHFSIPIEDDLSFVYPEIKMAKELFDLLDSDRAHLRSFLDFVDTSTDQKSQEDYIRMKLTGVANGTDRLFLIAKKNAFIGCMDLHGIDIDSKKAEIGYWLHSKYTNQGIVTTAVRKICAYSFDFLELNKLDIIADTQNSASNAVAKKCGFHLVGTQKEDRMMYGEYRDMNRYSLLKSEFRSIK